MWRSTPFACAKSSIAEKLVPGCMSAPIPSAATLSSFQHEQRVARGRPLQNALCAYITIQGWAARAAGLFAASRSASSHSKNSDARLRFVFGFQTPAGQRVREMVVGAECKRRLSSGVRTVSGAHPLLRVHLRAVPDLRVDGDEVNQLSPRRNRRPVSDKHASNTRPVGTMRLTPAFHEYQRLSPDAKEPAGLAPELAAA